MAALEAAIQNLFGSRTLVDWMAGSSPAMTIWVATALNI
jgi:hypothetical protein